MVAKGERAVPYSLRHSYSLCDHLRGIDAGIRGAEHAAQPQGPLPLLSVGKLQCRRSGLRAGRCGAGGVIGVAVWSLRLAIRPMSGLSCGEPL
jgi:hypothetical protein